VGSLDDTGSSTVRKSYDSDYLIKRYTIELDVQRQKNIDIAKNVTKTLDIKDKENK